jgi:DNA-binding MarR family transcriptional regulator
MGNSNYFTDHSFNLTRLLFITQHAMAKGRDRELAPYNITTEQAGVLHTIRAIGYSPTIREISLWLMREAHTITNLVARMEEKGLVIKFRELHNKKAVRVALTPKGEEAFQKSIGREFYNRVTGVLSEEEQAQLYHILSKLRDKAIKEIKMRTPPFPFSF